MTAGTLDSVSNDNSFFSPLGGCEDPDCPACRALDARWEGNGKGKKLKDKIARLKKTKIKKK